MIVSSSRHLLSVYSMGEREFIEWAEQNHVEPDELAK